MSSNDISDVLWPLCLGSFDEESCRFFLRQLGKRVVPFYPFSLGMEEVYSVILGEYGFDGTPDALSVLQELLEDEQTANGLGDDGDIWRSWRHSWRHRNDDALSPFIPRAGGLILRPATMTGLRLLKATNFAQHQIHLGENQKLSRCAYRPSGKPSETTEDFCNVNNLSDAMLSQTPEKWKYTSNRARRAQTESSTSLKNTPRLRGGRIDLSGHHASLPLNLNKASSYPKSQPRMRIRQRSLETSIPTCVGSQTSVTEHVVSSNINSSPGRGCTVNVDPIYVMACYGTPSESSVFHQEATSPAPISKRGSESTEHNVKFGEDSEIDVKGIDLRSGQRRRAYNRQARLIDGAIFTSDERKGRSLATRISIDGPEPIVLNTKALVRQSWAPTHQKHKSGENWFHTAWSRFRGERSQKHFVYKHTNQQTPALAQDVSPVKHSIMTVLRKRAATNGTMPASQSTHIPHFGLDGASDIQTQLRRSDNSSCNLNKPLPLSPTQKRKSVTSEMQHTFFAHSSEPSTKALSDSASLSIGSQSPNRDDFRNLVGATMTGPHELSSIKEIGDFNSTLSGSRVSPQQPPPSSVGTCNLLDISDGCRPLSFTSMVDKNPFIDSPTTPRFPPPLFIQKHQISSEIWPFRPSTTEIEFVPNTVEPVKQCVPLAGEDLELETKRSSANQSDEGHTTAEGDICPWQLKEEKQCFEHAHSNNSTPRTPRTRSRSPMRRFLGLNKPNTTKSSAGDASPKPAQPPSSSTKKRTLKDWSNKLRYGFLIADREQLEQEKMMDQHLENMEVTITPPRPSRSTFPISIRPPAQARLIADIEVIMCVTANNFLMTESKAGRISAESVATVRGLWQARNRQEVTEFYYDQSTQHNLILANLKTIKLYGQAANDFIALNSTLHQWRIMAKEMGIRVFCVSDSTIRRWLHDARRVMDLLDASVVTVLAFEDLQLATLHAISEKQRQRAERRDASTSTQAPSIHYRNISIGSSDQTYQSLPTRTGHAKGNSSPLAASFTNNMRKRPHPDHAIMQLPRPRESTPRKGCTDSIIDQSRQVVHDPECKSPQQLQSPQTPRAINRQRFIVD